MPKLKSVFPIGASGRGCDMVTFLAELVVSGRSEGMALPTSISVLKYCERFYQGASVASLEKDFRLSRFKMNQHCGRYANLKHCWLLQIGKGKQTLFCYLPCDKQRDYPGNLDLVIPRGWDLISVTKVTKLQRDRMLKTVRGNDDWMK